MKEVISYSATVWVGFREHYSGVTHTMDEVREICQKYVDNVGWCFTLTPTEFVYKGGSESGVAIGLINYPRFPSTKEKIEAIAVEIGRILRREFNQYRVSIVFPEKTIMLEDE